MLYDVLLNTDALIGSTATIYRIKLITANDKHYKIIKELEMEVFRPT